jgi:ATP-binding cassette, subfamily C, bacterial CydCD
LLAVLQALFLSRLVSGVFLQERLLSESWPLLGWMLGIIMLRAGVAWSMETSSFAIGRRVKQWLREQLFRHLVRLGPVYALGEEEHHKGQAGEIANTLYEGIEALDSYYGQFLPQLALSILVPIIILAFVFPIDLLSGIVLLVTAPLIPIFMVLIGELAGTLTRRQFQSLSRMSAYFLDVLQGLTTLKTLGRSQGQTEVISRVGHNFRRLTMKVLRVAFLSSLSLELAATLSIAVVAVQVGLRLLYGYISFEQAFFVLILAPEFYLPLRMLGTKFHSGMAGAASAERIFEILDRPANSGTGVPDPTGQRPGLSPPFKIRFDEVKYKYPNGRLALRGVSFEIGPGQKVALIGRSGAGKSTLVQLLLNFINPEIGKIEINDRSLDCIPGDVWRSQVAWVGQAPYLFNDTVVANIRLAKPEASDKEIERAARLANAHEFIMDLSNGYATQIGERAARLSGGQAQRLALARAFLKDAPVLILDEVTSALDPDTEADLVEATHRLMRDRTVIVIAHRLNTITGADKVFVLDEGELVEAGSPTELMRNQGVYYSLLMAASRQPTQDLSLGKKDHIKNSIDREGQPLLSSIFFGPSNANSALSPSYISPAPVKALDSAYKQNSTCKTIRQLWSHIAPYKLQIALSTLLGFATFGSAVGLMGASAFIISAAALQPSIAELQVAIVGVRFFGLARGVFRYLDRLVSHDVTFRVLADIRTWFYRSLEPLAPARLENYKSGDLLARILTDIASLENFYVRSVAPPFSALLLGAVIFAYLASFSLHLGLALLTVYLGCGLGIPILTRLASMAANRQLVAARAELQAAVVDGVQGLADLMAFGQTDAHLKLIVDWENKLAGAQKRLAWVSGMQNSLLLLGSHLGIWMVLVISIPLVSAGVLNGVYLAVLGLVALTAFEAIQPLPQAAQHLESSLQAHQRLQDVVSDRPETIDPTDPLPLPSIISLEVRNLSFRYPSERNDEGFALHDISFRLPEGKRLALIGPSGAGKSTLVNLLMRFWEFSWRDPSKAQEPGSRILLGGNDLHRYRPADLRQKIGVVSQTTYLFSATIRENLLLARPEATEESLIRASTQAQIHDFICELPEGYDTWIGEGGFNLSAGQRQRLALARTLLKDPPLLILDEPTANLDAQSEAEVIHSIHCLMEGRTTLWITHRLVGMEWMDEIIVLDQGSIVERGRHSELLAREGLYHRLWRLQNQFLFENRPG